MHDKIIKQRDNKLKHVIKAPNNKLVELKYVNNGTNETKIIISE